jgi:hypothetical protein
MRLGELVISLSEIRLHAPHSQDAVIAHRSFLYAYSRRRAESRRSQTLSPLLARGTPRLSAAGGC